MTRKAASPLDYQMIRIGDWNVSPGTCTIAKIDRQQETKVTPRSMDVLRLLIEREGQVVSPAEFLDTLWRSPIATDHAVHKAIAELRSALQDNAHRPRYIKTIPKRGYALIMPVERNLPTAPDSVTSIRALPTNGTAAGKPAADSNTDTNAAPPDQTTADDRKRWLLPELVGWRRKLSLAAALVAAIVGVQLFYHTKDATPEADGIVRLVVLPFSSRDFSDENQSLADGIRESLIHGLSTLGHLHVLSPPRYASVSDAAISDNYDDFEHAGHVLQGSVMVANGRLRVIVQLIRAADGLREYSDQFDLSMNDIFAVQDEIVTNVVSALRVYLNDQERAQMQDWGTTNPLAYERFLLGEFYNNQFNAVDWKRAMSYHRSAIALDPNFLNAYHGLATAANNTAVYSGGIDQIAEMYQVVMDVHREISRIAPDSEILDSLQAIKLRLRGSSYVQQETQMREQILSGEPPPFVMAHYALLLIGARMYDEAIRFLDRTAEVGPYEISPDEAWSYRMNVLTPRESIMAHKNQLQQRPFHMSFLGSVAINLALLGDFRQAQVYANQQREVDTEGIPSHYTHVVTDFLAGNIHHGDGSYERALRDHPDFYYNNGVLAFMMGDLDAGVNYWQNLQSAQLRRLFNLTHSAEKYFPADIINSAAYQALLESLGAGISWQQRLMEGVMAMEHVTGVGLHSDSLRAYEEGQIMMKNNYWSAQDWAELEHIKNQRRLRAPAVTTTRIH